MGERSLHRTLDISKLDFNGQRVLMRADFNVPLSGKQIADDTRIRATVPTIDLLRKGGAILILASHMGRCGSALPHCGQSSLAPVAAALKDILGDAFVGLAEDCIGDAVSARIGTMKPGQVLLLENTRFHKGDTQNDDAFAEALAKSTGAEVFIMDAFGVSHRNQASVTGITKFVPKSYPGPLVRKEVLCLARSIDVPKRPFVVVLGGAKVVDKLHIISILIDKADKLIIGGKMAFTFLKAKGVSVGDTEIEEAHRVEEALEMERKAAELHKELYLPIDQVVAEELEQGAQTKIPIISNGFHGGDIGPASQQLFADALADAGTIFWNGPLGKFEVPEFSKGTYAMAKAIAAATKRGAITIIGGGDSVSAVKAAGCAHEDFTHISTGGGASLELIEGNKMPGLRALTLGV
ncbi:phosphoglycerate kinase [Coccomyxa subellipsoidea C-169]|uniref:Phosphoglycerate kinase n=1 Tax=Coccomyxa subellipsoidea (strain C-169) TaxID=574566 RepID=I0YYL6_COCSC|nr:phosphoglycerate kinase [Coccomyxa subellipsoidea C-169]EIE23485.1 phosphoglycerate kinase [Coccomyxa subellipsoidea C-169]|eukprot:XP_005648029.1 phosphoglycerate kinase [Coccomyxa subellipsoidea C-169]